MYEYKPKVHFGFDPKIDKQKVDPSGMIDLRKAYASGAVDGSVNFEDGAFNGVQDPSVLMDRPKDQFERMRQAAYVKESLRAAKANAEAGHHSGEAN